MPPVISFWAHLMVLCSSVSFAIASCCFVRAFCHSFSAVNPNQMVHQSSRKAKSARHGLIKPTYLLRVHTSRVRSQGGSGSGFGSGGGGSCSCSRLLGSGNDAQGLDGLCIGERLERLQRRQLLLLSSKPLRSRGQKERGKPGSQEGRKNGANQAILTGWR